MSGKPSQEKPWVKYHPKGSDNAQIPEKTPYQYLYERNREYMSGIALQYYGTKIGYAEFFRRIEAAARSFKALGVKKGEIVTLSMPNTPEGLVCFYALNKIGAVANMVMPFFEGELITYSLAVTETKMIIILDLFYDKMKKMLDESMIEKVVIVSPTESLPPAIKLLRRLRGKAMKLPPGERFMDWKAFTKAAQGCDAVETEPFVKRTPAVVVYSSGSTGSYKGIVLPNEAFVSLSVQIEATGMFWKPGEGQKKCLAIGPIFISTGLNGVLNMGLCFNDILILEPVFNEDVFAKRMKQHKVNYTMTTPSHFTKLLETDIKDLSQFVIPVAAGEAVPEPLEASINKYFEDRNSEARLLKGWGMCEFGSGVTITMNNDKVRKGTGKPLPLNIVGVFDLDTDEELGYNQRGEIRAISPCSMLGYLDNPESTDEFFREGKDGRIWGCSGDLGYIDEEGNVFIEGRKHDHIITEDGSKVWLFDIENTLLRDEAVQLSEAVGLAVGDKFVPVAHLVLKEGHAESDESILLRLHKGCLEALPPCAVPHGYRLRDSFSILPSGKRDLVSLKNDYSGFVLPSGDGLRPVEFAEF